VKLRDCIHSHPTRAVLGGRCGSRGKSQGGAALIVALLIFALCTALIVAMKSDFDLYYQRGANAAISEQIYAYLRGAEQLGTIALQQDYDNDLLRPNQVQQDDLSEIWAQPALPQSLPEGGWWKGNLVDLQGRFNLNTLNKPPRAQGQNQGMVGYDVAQKQFIRLLTSIEVSRQDAQLITESIGDWLDADNQPRDNGAEDDYYSVQTPAYRAANQLMTSVSELRLVAYVTPEIYSALIQLGALTVLPSDNTTINLYTASAAVLRTLNDENNLTPLDEIEAAELLAYIRSEESGPTSKQDVLDHAVLAGKTVTELSGQLGISSSYFLLNAEAKVADRTLRLYSVLHRNGRLIEVIGRASGDL
jgi:general secretion pathway protein K